MAASRAKPTPVLPTDTTLVQYVQATVDALDCGPADAGVVGLAFTMANAIDAMDAETRGRMAGQTCAGLLRVLVELRAHAKPKASPSWSEQHPRWAAQR